MFIMYFDFLIYFLVLLLVMMIFSGISSLMESKLMATMHNRVGPALFLMGLVTPIFDGVKLLLKFNVIVMNVDLLYLFLMSVLSFAFNYFMLFYLPITNIIFMEMNYMHFMLLSFHLALNMVNVILVGCYMVTTCFVYLSTMRVMITSLISELALLMFFIMFFFMNFYTLLNFNVFNNFNIVLKSFFFMPVSYICIFLIITYLNALTVIFEYAEAESELVAGTMTEFSGIFFCLSSLMEIFHIILNVFLILIFFFGGLFFNFKMMLFFMMLFLLPKFMLVRVKLNILFFLFFYFIFMFLFLLFIFLNLNKLFLMFVF